MICILFYFNREKMQDDNEFLDGDDNHIYYDRHLIDKKEFQRNNPDEKDVRTFRRLVGLKSKNKKINK